MGRQMSLSVKEELRLARALRRNGYRASLQQRREIVARIKHAVDGGDFCVICRQDKGHRRVYGYGDVQPHPIAFGSTWQVVEQNGELTFKSKPT